MISEVLFPSKMEEDELKFAVIAAKFKGTWVFCKHRDRDTLEVPGGHRECAEDGRWIETVEEAARRELYEETGALEFDLRPVTVYGVRRIEGKESYDSYGMLFYADITRFGLPPELEIARICLLEEEPMPDVWTYPLIQPILMKKIAEYLDEREQERKAAKPAKHRCKVCGCICDEERDTSHS